MMKKTYQKLFLVLSMCLLLAVTLAAAGCGGSGGQRITGLAPEGVVQTFFDLAKANNLNSAGLYVSPDSANNPQTALSYLTGQKDLKSFNILSLKKVAEQGDFSVVVATLQQQNTLSIQVKPVGLQRINGEWYIVDANQVYQDAKYALLQQLMKRI